MDWIKQAVHMLIELTTYLIVIEALVSWMPYRRNKILHVIEDITDFILKPVRHFVKPIGNVDISPIIAIIILQIVDKIVERL